MTSVLSRTNVGLDVGLPSNHHHSNGMAYRPTMHYSHDNNNKPSKVSNSMHYRGSSRDRPASPPPDYGGFNDPDSPPDSPKLPRFDYNNDRIQNDLLQEICSDIGIKDAMDLDFYDFDTNMFTDKRESYGSEGDVLDQVIPFGQLQQQQEDAQLDKVLNAIDPSESVSQACSTAPSANVSPNRPGSSSEEDDNLICFKDEVGAERVNIKQESEGERGAKALGAKAQTVPSSPIPTSKPSGVPYNVPTSQSYQSGGKGHSVPTSQPGGQGVPDGGPPSVSSVSSSGGPPDSDKKMKPLSPYPQSPAASIKSVGSPAPSSSTMGPPSNQSHHSHMMGPPSNQSVHSYHGPPSNQSVHEVPASPGVPEPPVQVSVAQTRTNVHPAVSHAEHSHAKGFVLTGMPGMRRGRNLESPFDQGYYSVGSGSMYTGSHYGSNSDLASTGDTPPMSATDKVEEFLTSSVGPTSGTVTESHGGMIPQSHSTPLPRGQGILPPNSHMSHMQPNRTGKNVTFAVPAESRPHDFNAFGKRPSEAQLTPRPDVWDQRVQEPPQGPQPPRIKTGSQPSSPKKLRVSYTPDTLSPTKRLVPPGEEDDEEEPPFDPSLFPSHQGLMKHLITDRSSAFRSHPFFPLLRDLIIADMNFFTPTFPFALIANLPTDFDRLVQNYIHRNPTLATMPRANQAVESVFMDALRYAHKSLIEKISERKKQEGDIPSKSSSAIEDFCDRFDRAVKNTAASQGVNVGGGMIGQPQVSPAMLTPQGPGNMYQHKMAQERQQRAAQSKDYSYNTGPPGSHAPTMFQPSTAVPSDFNFQTQAMKQQHPQQRHPGYETPPPSMQSYQPYQQQTPSLQRQNSHQGMYRVNRNPHAQYGPHASQMSPAPQGQMHQAQGHPQGQMAGQPGQLPHGMNMPAQTMQRQMSNGHMSRPGHMPHSQGQMPQTPSQMPQSQGQMPHIQGHISIGQMPGQGQIPPGPMSHGQGQMPHSQVQMPHASGQMLHSQGQMSGAGQMPHTAGQMSHGQGQMIPGGRRTPGQMSSHPHGSMPGQMAGHTQGQMSKVQMQYGQNMPYQQHMPQQYQQRTHNNMPHTPQTPEMYNMEPNLANQGMLSKSMTCLPGQYGNQMGPTGPGQGGVYRPQSSPDLPRHVSMSMPRPPSAGGYNEGYPESRPLGHNQRSLSQGQTVNPMGGQYNQKQQYYDMHKAGSLSQLPTGPNGQIPQYTQYDVQSGSEEDSRPDTPSDRSSNASSKKQVLPKEAVAVMLAWLKDHQHNPYPNEIEKEHLIAQTGLTISQLNYWFTNARRRILPKWLLQRLLEDQAIASGDDPAKVKVTGSAQEVRQIAKDMLQGKTIPYLGGPTQSPSPPVSLGSPLWPSSEETKNYSTPTPPSSGPEYFNVSQPQVFANYNANQNNYNVNNSQYQRNNLNEDLILFTTGCNDSHAPDNVGYTNMLNTDLLNGNMTHFQPIKCESSNITGKEENSAGDNTSIATNDDKHNVGNDEQRTTLADLSFLLSS